MGEQILVFKTRLMDGFKFQGVLTKRPMMDFVSKVLWDNKELLFMDRDEAEKDPGFKQIIAYSFMEDMEGNIFSYERTKKGGENRLHGYRSIGVGGHVAKEDGDEKASDKTYIKALAREIKEEVGLVAGEDYDNRIVAAINDDSNEVGRVHLGCVEHIVLYNGSKEKMKLEGALANGQWLSPAKLKEDVEMYESWSKLLINSGVL